MLLFSSGLLLTAWIIGWLVFDVPSHWVHSLLLVAVIPMIMHVVRTAPSKRTRRHGR